MLTQDYEYHYANLEALDPDQLVADLGLTTEEIMDAFPTKVAQFIHKEFG